jgi:hypothetical protein
MKGIQKYFKSPFFVSMATAAKFVQPIPICLAYLVPLDVDVTGNITAQMCAVWSEFSFFLHLGSDMATKVKTLLTLFQASRNFTVMFLVTCRFANRDIKFQNGCS